MNCLQITEQVQKSLSKKTEKKKKKVKTEVQADAGVADDGVPAEHADGRFSNFPIRPSTIIKLESENIWPNIA